jgi:hypothetical protein
LVTAGARPAVPDKPKPQERRSTSGAPAGSAKPQTPAADDLGQEGVQNTIKPNTTKKNERQDRGP